MTDDFHFYLLRRADDYVTAIRPTADIDRFGFPAWHGWAISKAWRDGYAAAINEGGQAPCESTDGCTRAQVTWEQAISHAGTDHEMAAQPVPPSPDDTKRATVLPPLDDSESIDSWLIRHADGVPQKYWGPIRVLGDAIAALRAERDALRAELAEDAGGWARAERAEAECDALRADAERYRWLRAAQSQTARNWIVINNRNMYGEHELDAAIDAARKEQQ